MRRCLRAGKGEVVSGRLRIRGTNGTFGTDGKRVVQVFGQLFFCCAFRIPSLMLIPAFRRCL
jgi:hypothetical protein